MQPQVWAVPPGQLVRAFCNFHAASENAAKRRIKKAALPCCGQVQHCANWVQKVAVRNPALQAVRGAGLDDLARLAYAIAPRVGHVQIPALEPLGDGLPAQAW